MYFRIVFLCFDNTTVKRLRALEGFNENNDKTVENASIYETKKDHTFDMG